MSAIGKWEYKKQVFPLDPLPIIFNNATQLPQIDSITLRDVCWNLSTHTS